MARWCRRLAGGALATGLAAAPAMAQQEISSLGLTVTTTPAFTSDYIFRGISQTRRNVAGQLTLDVAHSSGFYVGGFISNVSFLGTNARQETDVVAGYRTELAGFNLDAGIVYYAYAGYNRRGGYNLDWLELAVRGSRTFDPVTVTVSGFYTPNFQLQSGNSFYLEGQADVKLPYGFTASGRVGYQWIERNQRFGVPDYLNWSAGLSYDLPAGFTLSAGYYDTNVARRDCAGGQDICGATGIVSLSRKF
ncbi:TorF family putative porin [Roseomonas sp. NAR14]|uniref:TorF family putative porin n=1 Tax=Roseomonas acroporae TaxID=2937791 RepID=A0A9X1Y5R3_9PROT|nr:TorF family putative porin [Roseomonas acroporae]MCK8783758.1 TorF family putative porin [Roseomonas acroporae]